MPKTANTIRIEPLHCVICTREISLERTMRKSVTCSEEHAKELKERRRRLRNANICRQCGRPATPEQIESWKQWRATVVKRGRPPKIPDVASGDAPSIGEE